MAHSDRNLGGGEEYELRLADDRAYGDGDGRIIAWRVKCFEAFGLSHAETMALAIRRDVDRDHAELLLKAGYSADDVLGFLT